MIKNPLLLLCVATICPITLRALEGELAHLNNALTQLASIVPPILTTETGPTKESQKKYAGYTIECLQSSSNHNNPIEEKDKASVEALIKQGEIMCTPVTDEFNFPPIPLDFPNTPSGRIRSAIFRRILSRYSGGDYSPNMVTDAYRHDYIFLVRNSSNNIIAVGDGYLSSSRGNIRSYLNIIYNKDISHDKKLLKSILYNIANQATNIYINNARKSDKRIMYFATGLEFAVPRELGEELEQYLKLNNDYIKNSIATVHLTDGTNLTIKRNPSDKEKDPETITCSKQALMID